MPAPTNVHTWEIDSNIVLAGTASRFEAVQRSIWNIKNSLIGNGNITTNPWTVIASADNTTYNPSGDEWTTAEGTDLDPYSWIVLERVDGFQIILQAGSDAFGWGTWFILSPGGLFTGGALNTRPTATDEVVVVNNAIFFANTNAPFPQVINVQQSQDGLNTRFWTFRSGGSPAFFALETPNDSTNGAWTNPWVYLGIFEAGTGDTPLYGDIYTSTTYTKSVIDGISCSFYCTSEAYSGTAIGNTAANQLTSEYPLGPMGLYCATLERLGRHGSLNDVWYGQAALVNGDTYNTQNYIQVGDIVLPWDGSAPILTA